MIILGLLAGIFLTHNVKETKLYNDCKRGNQASCEIVMIKPKK